MFKTLHKWLDVFERLINLIRPKAYNTIAKRVIYSGLALIVESQVNLSYVVVAVLFEEYVGKSEILRFILRTSADPTVGLVLVFGGMFYHLTVTLGKDYIDVKKAALPRTPDFELLISTPKQKSDAKGQFYLDGPNCSYEHLNDIPQYEEQKPENEHSIARIRSLTFGLSPQQKEVVNSSLYQDRLDILKEWMGYEPFKLKLSNGGRVLAKGVRVRLAIPKNSDATIKERGATLPSYPKKKYYSIGGMSISQSQNNLRIGGPAWDSIFLSENDEFYEIVWNVESIQANVVRTSGREFLIKLSQPIEVKYTVFCDELPEPFSSKITIHPAQAEVQMTLNDVMDDSVFEKLYLKIAANFKSE